MIERVKVNGIKSALLTGINVGVPCKLTSAECSIAMDYIELLEEQLLLCKDKLETIKDLAATGLPTQDMDIHSWNSYRLGRIETIAAHTLDKIVIKLERTNDEE